MRRQAVALATALFFFSAPSAFPQAEADRPTPPGEKPPQTVFERIDRAGNADDYPGEAYLIVLDRSVNRVKETGVTYVDGYMLYKVLTPEGEKRLSVLRWDYDPLSSYVEVREVNLIRDGKRIPVDLASLHDLPAPQSMIYWGNRIKTLQLPRLRVGDGIEVRTFRKGFTYALLAQESGGTAPGSNAPGSNAPGDERYIPPMEGEYFDIVLFQADVPTIEKRYELQLPADKRLHSREYNGPLYSSTSYSKDSTVYAWWGLDLPPRIHEPRQPAASDFVPKVVLATVESWQAKSRWFFDVNNNQFTVTPPIKAKIEEILRDQGLLNADEERKARALVHWVAQNIRYSGQTMGEGEGYTLHPGDMIFEQRSGVCKDIAGMLVTMFRGAGLDAYPAMTMAGSRIEDLPADQFNHCVVALHSESGRWVMYDPTWVPFNNDIWSKLETEQQYLIGSPEGHTLSEIRYSPPEESPLHVRHDAELFADGTLAGTIRLESSGAMDSRLRRIVYRSAARDFEDDIRALLAPLSDRIEDLRITHREAEDFSGDMWMEIRYRAPGYGLPVAGGLEFHDPLMPVLTGNIYLFRAGYTDWKPERKTDVFLYYTQLLDVVETLKLPKGFTVQQPPQSEEVDADYGYFKGTSEVKRGKLTILSRAEVRRRQIPPSGYEGFYNAMEEAKSWAGTLFRAEPKGGAR
ncbi:MAG TPA: DUF3857 domain-containing protein [Bacteroidetes bacterium]|nr:DUF3857 domain-containing protein [Bacteroidota bacterium]